MTSPGTVLVIDDDEAITQAFARTLRLEGFQVRIARSAEKGLQEAETVRLDAIILDLRMPMINGVGFLYRLRMRDNCRHTPVAMVTGDYTVDDLIVREVTELGAQLHFKPLWVDDLLGLALALVGAEPRLTGSRSVDASLRERRIGARFD
jgi:DNA-binding response OmpR family regulator